MSSNIGYCICVTLLNGHNREFYFDSMFDAETCFKALRFANYSTGEFSAVLSEIEWNNGKATLITILQEI